MSNIQPLEVISKKVSHDDFLKIKANKFPVSPVKKIQNSYAEMLSHYNWDYYVTFTTGYTMTLPSARRLMTNYHSKMKTPGQWPFFWCAEKFEVKDGYHTHALMQVPNGIHYNYLVGLWQRLTGGSKTNTWNRIDLQNYDPRLGASHYVSEYVTKRMGDFDLLF